jgi:KipI family sensor histidine kinase inhibitor
MINVRILRVGETAALLELSPAEDVEAWSAELWRRRERGDFVAVEVVAGARTILVDGVGDIESFLNVAGGWAPPPGSASVEGELVTIPVRYDGEDLEWVAQHFGTSVDVFIARHLETEFHVAFCGFAPGFAYMTGLNASVPRLPTPRTRVPAGSVGLADAYCGIYPTASPGGWRLIGSTDVVMFDPGRESPALLPPGTRVRFRRVNA